MTDLRDAVWKTAEDRVFLDYHGNSPYARAKVEAGLRLPPEALEYMRRELAERARAKAEYETRLKDERNAERKDAGLPPVSDDERDGSADGVRGSESSAPAGG